MPLELRSAAHTLVRASAFLGVLLWLPQSVAAELRIAVATNFAPTLHELVAHYQQSHPDFQASVSSASSGKHFAQIRQGAPFHLFFSADDLRTADLIDSGDALVESRFTYAVGKLVLWSSDPELIPEDGWAFLRAGRFDRLAVANPRVAPYGVAAYAVLAQSEVKREQTVTGQSIGQTFNVVRSGNAEAGLVAASLVIAHERRNPVGSQWQPPTETYPPIVQEAILLRRGVEHPWAAKFLHWVRCDSTAHVFIQRDGYQLPDKEAHDDCVGH